MHQGFVVLLGWADVSAVQKKVFLNLNSPSAFPTESSIEIYRFSKSIFLGEETLCVVERQKIWNLIPCADVAAVH